MVYWDIEELQGSCSINTHRASVGRPALCERLWGAGNRSPALREVSARGWLLKKHHNWLIAFKGDLTWRALLCRWPGDTSVHTSPYPKSLRILGSVVGRQELPGQRVSGYFLATWQPRMRVRWYPSRSLPSGRESLRRMSVFALGFFRPLPFIRPPTEHKLRQEREPDGFVSSMVYTTVSWGRKIPPCFTLNLRDRRYLIGWKTAESLQSNLLTT